MTRNISTIFTALFIIALLFTMTACSAQKIADVKTSGNVGKEVAVKGKVSTPIKIGSLSGYMVKDDTGRIPVSSEKLPKEGDTVTVKGVLINDLVLGYYIKVN